MKKQFKEFSNNIRLTEEQEIDAKTKYDGVCTKLHDSYYDSDYDGKTKLLFGSYRTKTNVRPITKNQDVDVIFKIPQETYDKFKAYESNGPSSLLQEVKDYLNEKYTTTDNIKAWGKVVKVEFADSTHNIEVLPAFEEDDFTFTIPNSENGGSWDFFDPREQLNNFQSSNNTSKGLTAELTRIIKTWVDNTPTCDYKSYNLLSDVMQFLNKNFTSGAEYSDYSNVVKSFFEYLNKNCEDTIKSFVESAKNRAKKAFDYENENKPKEASEEWRKIFGSNGNSEFPHVKSNPVKESKTRVFTNPSAPYGSYKSN